MNIAEIEMQISDLVNAPFDPSEFVFNFIEIFNPPKATLTKLRKGTKGKDRSDGELLWPRKLHYRVSVPGQAANVVDTLKEQKIAKNKAPRFIISTDGNEFSALDTKADESLHCDFKKLNDHFDFFLPLAGINKYEAVDENPADIKAAGRLAKFHDEIIRTNPDWHTPEKRHALNQFMTRILFCLFAEDTGSLKSDLFVKTITEFGGDNGEHLQLLLKQIFDVMDVSVDLRSGIPVHIDVFPYVNGGLFAEQTEVPVFGKRAKRLLIDTAGLDWREINPDIFGSMIQAVVDDSMRGDLGMHYTSVPNIMKVLQPLFLMSLEEELADAHGHREERARLKRLLTRISKIRVFDPACGSGNFLIIAYRELRTLEMRILQREDDLKGGQVSHRWESGVKLSNYYGIELADFAAETAKLSLWIAEYQMNQRFKSLFGEAPPDFPLKEGGHVFQDSALKCDWHVICPKEEDKDVETFIVGNPPYLGARNQSAEQKEDMKSVFLNTDTTYNNLDYVAAWYLKAADYCQKQNAQSAMVATNSICQGEQVAILWPLIFKKDIEISFAHQSFEWKNLATNNAGITCVIVGMRKKSNNIKILFHDNLARKVEHIGPYLIEMKNTIINKSQKPLNGLPNMMFGNMPNDGGQLLLSFEDKEAIVNRYPEASSMIRSFYGSQEFIRGIDRWCLWINEENIELAHSIPPIMKRIECVENLRLSSKRDTTKKLAKYPHRFGEIRGVTKEHAIIVPSVTTGIREYFPCGLLKSDSIISNLAFALYDAPIYLFSIISSRLHILWIRTVCGKMRSHYRYSNTLGYNTFPIPLLSTDQKEEMVGLAWAVISARESHPGKTMEWLYDPKTMPDGLLAAHRAIDDSLEKVYIGRPFKDDTERLEHLFKLYEEMTAPRNDNPKKEAVNA